MIDTQSPDLSVLIVNWNVRDLLGACLDSIAAGPVTLVAADGSERGGSGPCVEVIVVDSASTDGSAAWIARALCLGPAAGRD